MTDHVGDEIASPEIDGSKNRAEGQGENDVERAGIKRYRIASEFEHSCT